MSIVNVFEVGFSIRIVFSSIIFAFIIISYDTFTTRMFGFRVNALLLIVGFSCLSNVVFVFRLILALDLVIECFIEN